jgi:hypothetical protein
LRFTGFIIAWCCASSWMTALNPGRRFASDDIRLALGDGPHQCRLFVRLLLGSVDVRAMLQRSFTEAVSPLRDASMSGVPPV